jgi:hypothetical protein
MPALTPAERRLRAEIAAHVRWSTPGQREAASRAQRDRILAWAESQVDPDRKLPDAERAQLAENHLRAHMARMALAASRSRARARKKAG